MLILVLLRRKILVGYKNSSIGSARELPLHTEYTSVKPRQITHFCPSCMATYRVTLLSRGRANSKEKLRAGDLRFN